MALAQVRSSAPDTLAESLKYDTRETASYVKERASTTFYPLGGATYSFVQGTKLIRFVLSDGRAFIDPSAIALNFRIRNTGVGRLKFRGPPLTIFQRRRLLVRGAVIDDNHEVTYTTHLLRITETQERQANDAICRTGTIVVRLPPVMMWESHQARAGGL